MQKALMRNGLRELMTASEGRRNEYDRLTNSKDVEVLKVTDYETQNYNRSAEDEHED